MATGPTFLATARSRLLPASVPFRFFGGAVVFHLVAWLALVAGADQAVRFRGGLGWPLAALHAVTLGVMVMTAIGASIQLFPVATRVPVVSRRAPAWLWWLYTPGVTVLVVAMAMGRPEWILAGALAVVAALAGFAMLMALNLRDARGMPVVVAHGWAALVCLALALASALAMVATYAGWPVWAPPGLRGVHVAFAVYGFMGLMAMGLSLVLVPMFALAPAPPARPAGWALGYAVAGLVAATAPAFGIDSLVLSTGSLVAGAIALTIHLRLLRSTLNAGMRKQLGRPFVLIRLGWAGWVASLGLAIAMRSEALSSAFERLPTLFGVTLVAALLGFLLGMLTRIAPFLASMHAPRGRRGAVTPSALISDSALALFFHCHLAGIATLLVAVIVDSAGLARVAGVIGTLGALAYAYFLGVIWWRMTGHGTAPPGGRNTGDRSDLR